MGRGGQNRTHLAIEYANYLDSFVVGKLCGPHTMRWRDGNSIAVTGTGDSVKLAYRFHNQDIREPVMISRVPNNYGGARPFFLCPGCGRRVRFLYLHLGWFRCRNCARLNYRSQQATKDEFIPYHAAVKLLRKRFKVPEDQIPVPMDLPHFWPGKPKRMHWATYCALLERYGALMRQYSGGFSARARAILSRL